MSPSGSISHINRVLQTYTPLSRATNSNTFKDQKDKPKKSVTGCGKDFGNGEKLEYFILKKNFNLYRSKYF